MSSYPAAATDPASATPPAALVRSPSSVTSPHGLSLGLGYNPGSVGGTPPSTTLSGPPILSNPTPTTTTNSSNHNGMPSWLAQLHAQLEKHEQLGAATRDVLDDYTRLFSQTLYLAKSNADMLAQRTSASAQRRVSVKDTSRPTSAASQQQQQQQQQQLRPQSMTSALSDPADMPASPPSASAGNSATADPRWDQLVAEKERVDSELNRTMHQVKQLQSQLAQSERSVRKLSSEVTHLKSAIRDLQIKLHDATHLLTTKDTVIMIAQDELTAAQIELSTKEDKLAVLEKENRDLLDRWLAYKADEAIRMNAATASAEPVAAIARNVSSKLRAFGSYIQGVATAPVTPAYAPEPQQPPRSWPPRTTGTDAEAVPRRLVRSLIAHDSEAFCLATSRDGALVASGGGDKAIKVWSPGNAMSPLATLPNALGSVLALAFSSASNMLASGSSDNIVRVYVPPPPPGAAGAHHHQQQQQMVTNNAPTRLVHTFTGHMGKVMGVAIAGRDDVLVSCSADRTIKVWDMARGYCAKTLMAFSACMDVAIGDYSAATLVSAHLDGKVRVWDSESGGMGAEVVVAEGRGEGVCSVKVLDPSTIVTLARDNAIRVIDLRSQSIVNSIHSSFFRVGNTRLALSPGGGFVAAGAVDGSVFGWDMRTKEQTIVTGGHGTQVNEVSWNPHDPSQMYSIDKSGTLSVWGL